MVSHSVEHWAAERALLGRDEFVAALPGDAVLVRLDERGGREDPAPWAFGLPGRAQSLFFGPRDDEKVDAGDMRDALAAETRDGPSSLLSDAEEETATAFKPAPVRPAAGGAASVVTIGERVGSGAKLIVGRDAEAGLPLLEMSVSRAHAEIEARADGFAVRDLGSSNGTQVNGRPAPAGGYLLSPGDIVAFGDVECLFLDVGAFFDRVDSLMD